MEITSDFTEAAGDFVFGEAGEIADRCDSESLQHRRRFQLWRKTRERQRREKARFLARLDHRGRLRQFRGDSGGQFARCDAGTRGQADRLDCPDRRFSELLFVRVMSLGSADVGECEPVACIFDAR